MTKTTKEEITADAVTGEAYEREKIKTAAARSQQGIRGKLKKQYSLSIMKETARPAMQHLTDRLSSKRPVRSGRLTGFLAERNRKVNSRFPALENYAGCQGGGGDCDKLRFGLFCMRFNGCEVMAAYNILRLLGYNTDIREVAYHFETNGSVLLGGLGVRSDSIADYLEEKTGLRIRSLGPAMIDDYDSLFSEAKAAVLTFWNGPDKWTIHSVMLCHLRSGRVRAFNMHPGRLFSDFDSIASLCTGTGTILIPISLILVME